jgi:Ca-activated chloride channel family protein
MTFRYSLIAAAITLTLAACTQQGPLQGRTDDPNAPTATVSSDTALQELEMPAAPKTVLEAEPYSADQVASQAKLVAPSAAMAQRHQAFSTPMLAPTLPVTQDRETYAEVEKNGVMRVAEHPVSTFGIDVDTASYANVRRMLNEGRMPPHDAVRIEEMINYFGYDDPTPTSDDTPFRVSTEIATTPWNPDTELLRIGIRAADIDEQDLPASNLVFLIDVSGSMSHPDKLPLLKRSLSLLTQRLDAEDRVTLVVYAGSAGVVLEPTPGNERAKIEQALNELEAGGSTHGSAGIELAYAMAREAFIKEGVNRVILATDGDFNVGTVDHRALINLIERERDHGIALTTLGFGSGNLDDHLMEQLADHGNGNAAYIDSLLEAQKVLVEQIGGTLFTVASDVKIQVEFNPAQVAEYRLIGYENRRLRREDFNNDEIDSGELGAGHRVVALYEISRTGSDQLAIDPLRYGTQQLTQETEANLDELAYVKLRYKPRGSDASRLIEHPVKARETEQPGSESLRFAAAVAAFGQKLRGGDHIGEYSYAEIKTLAQQSRGQDRNGHRSAFLQLVALADALNGTQIAAGPNDAN